MTAQVAETLILNGRRRQMAFCPPLPPDHSLLLKTRTRGASKTTVHDGKQVTELGVEEIWTDRDGVEHIEPGSILSGSTACWRGYIGTWEIADGKLWLVRLEGGLRLATNGPLLAEWFTGVLRVPVGGMLTYVHMGFGSVYEKELHIAVERGRVKGRRTYDNRGKDHDPVRLGWQNLPGLENRFAGDHDFN